MSCYLCKSDSNYECFNCNKKFCSSHHLRLHLDKNDKCFPFDIKESEHVGRYLIANRDIDPGEIIFENEPLAFGPNHECSPICLGCFNSIELNYLCSKCGYPVCDFDCENSEVHSNECLILSKRNIKLSLDKNENDKVNYHVILPLRLLLLKKTFPEKYIFVQDLMDHENKRQEDSYRKECETKVVKNILSMTNEYSEKEIFHAIGVLEVNAYEINSSINNFGFRGLYPISSLISHSCVSNSKMIYEKEIPYLCKCIASVPIKKGDEISTNYVASTMSTMRRRIKLKNSWYFDCNCSRCEDPTELNSYNGALICSPCTFLKDRQFLIPNNPLDFESSYQCIRCENKISSNEYLSICQTYLDRVTDIAINQRYNVKEFLKVYNEAIKIFHPHNEVICELSKWLLPILCRDKNVGASESSIELLRLKHKIAFDQLTVSRILSPGLSKATGKLLFEYVEPLIYITMEEFNNGEINQDLFTSQLEKCIKICNETLKHFTIDDKHTPFERCVIKQAECYLNQCKELL